MAGHGLPAPSHGTVWRPQALKGPFQGIYCRFTPSDRAQIRGTALDYEERICFAVSLHPPLCVPKTSSKTPEFARIRWLAWRRLVCSSSPSTKIFVGQ
jgi:hypothetical protein